MIPADPSRDPFAPRPIDLPAQVPLEPDADLSVLDEAKILAAPADPADRDAWRAALHRWRAEARARTAYDDASYRDATTGWATTAWNVAMVWIWDEVVRDWNAERFDADRLLAAYDGFGGLDAVVLWHAYPVIGVDPRNQFDWYDVPGIEDLVRDLHARGVRVFLDYNPWDVGTRRTEHSDAARVVEVVTRLGADGVFLDTLKEGDPELLGALGGLEPRPVLEGESRVPLVRIADHQASWAQWFADSPTPGVLRARWFEQRHMMHHTRRWNRDHSEELRSAWVNGAGVLLWDVVFGVRVDWTERDRATLRAMRATYREHEAVFTDGDWEPLTPLAAEATSAGIAGSRWSLDGREVLTLVNPTEQDYGGPLLPGVDAEVAAGGLVGVLRGSDGAVTVLPISAPAGEAGPPPVPARQPVAPAYGIPAAEAVRPTPGERTLMTRWRQRETGLYEAAPYVDDWKPLPPRLHQLREEERAVRIRPVAVDRSPVTNGDFAAFVGATGYRPATTSRLLTHWSDGRPVPGTESEAVRHVDLADARAYAAWRGARLPTEDEWQAAAGEAGWTRGDPLVWEWTESEHRDGRTRWVVLKGGSWFAAEGSEWYVDGGPQPPEWSVRYLLTQAGTSRSECIGFRCAVDLPEVTPMSAPMSAPTTAPSTASSTGTAGTAADVVAVAPSGALGETITYRLHRTSGPDGPRATLYLLHGRGADLHEPTPLLEAIDTLVEAGAVPPLLVVVPDAPWSDRASFYVDSAFSGTPVGRPVETALTRDLVEHVDATYAALADRDHRFVGGYSMGGAGAVRYVLGRPDLFSGCVALSPAVFDPLPWKESSTREFGAFGRGVEAFVPEVYEALGYARQLAAFDAARPVRLFVAAGDREDLALEAARLHDRARRVDGIESQLRILGGDHDLDLWTRALLEGMAFVAGAGR
ncbi:S-formylglutathione hydrolase FrmB [Nocardioides terrae]|uniref:S-formylglutathione hydrolase FrmB n=1 Tax=Nocardioides terrae TaxID=574651 RepID=A0A1I1KBQ6_9ACTN|nr:SUMF1/EgtB/PvdO family nonheme iron enzyme [Nocardioides terrae]SFC58319.1 S-formylglutathione hydrolase FrmB [Nocardioides terrae]